MPAGKAPWDIGRPQPVFVKAADHIIGPILDAGCGTGENALFFAERGHKVPWRASTAVTSPGYEARRGNVLTRPSACKRLAPTRSAARRSSPLGRRYRPQLASCRLRWAVAHPGECRLRA